MPCVLQMGGTEVQASGAVGPAFAERLAQSFAVLCGTGQVLFQAGLSMINNNNNNTNLFVCYIAVSGSDQRLLVAINPDKKLPADK